MFSTEKTREKFTCCVVFIKLHVGAQYGTVLLGVLWWGCGCVCARICVFSLLDSPERSCASTVVVGVGTFTHQPERPLIRWFRSRVSLSYLAREPSKNSREQQQQLPHPPDIFPASRGPAPPALDRDEAKQQNKGRPPPPRKWGSKYIAVLRTNRH